MASTSTPLSVDNDNDNDNNNTDNNIPQPGHHHTHFRSHSPSYRPGPPANHDDDGNSNSNSKQEEARPMNMSTIQPGKEPTRPEPKPEEDRGAFEPEADDHLSHPNGAFYAGSRKDFPLPKSRYPLPRGSMQRILEPKPGSEGGRQRHYLDDPSYELQGFWTEDGNWVDWPPKGEGAAVEADGGGSGSGSKPQEQQEQQEDVEEEEEEDEQEAGSGTSKETNKEKEKDKDKEKEQSGHSMTVSATVGTRRQANGTIGSVYSGNKIRHLKKDDGIPLWRKDIQFEFLKLVFEDKTPAFTRLSDGQKGMDFADIYIDAMAKSSKTSRILKDKLQNEKPAAISMAMVCLLVNFGRMNTTLNCAYCLTAVLFTMGFTDEVLYSLS